MKNSTFFRVLLAAILLVFAGCASITRGTKQSVRIESEPAGATVTLSNGLTGKTPVEFQLPRKESVRVDFSLEGYEQQSARLSPMQSKQGRIATTGNVLIGGMIGAAIDGSNGADLDLVPNPLLVRLRPLRAANAPANWGGLKVGLARKDVRDLLGEPATVSDETGSQVWTYRDSGVVKFQQFFVLSWEAPAPASAAAPSLSDSGK